MSQFVYKSVIDNILNNFLEKRRYLPKNIHKIYTTTNIKYNSESSEYYRRSFPVWYSQYVQLLYKFLFCDVKISSKILTNFYNSLLEELEESGNCITDKIAIDLVNNTFMFRTEEKRILFSLVEPGQQEKISDFLDMINIISKKCRFFVFRVSFKSQREGASHLNMILGERLDDNNIILNYYEPHGFIKEPILKVINKIFSYGKSISREQNLPSITLNYNTSNVEGAQIKAGDFIGYCTMFSLFWIYIVLNIIIYNLKNNSYSPSPDWIYKVEHYYASSVSSDKLYEIIITFALELFNDYIHSLPVEEQKRIFEKIALRLNDYKPASGERKEKVEEIKEEREEKDENFDSYSEKELLELAERDPEVDYEMWEKAKERESERMKLGWKEFIARKGGQLRLGEFCRKHTECNSGRCKFENNSGIGRCSVPLQLGVKCKKNSDCASKRCYYEEDEKEGYCAAPLRSGRKRD